ncbi:MULTISPECIES: carbohydrate-binding protein [unclassified Amycolatopsis]|uniref:dioxygenase family protein n=1 Tax=unclassified Amycolatopsis TaxID=2618356 RepID=UPI00287546A3|nr:MULTISPECIES: carbohydrate-binding protein [unclassified Amycolatopsis]MDS0137506.1 dioxygenase [Amycolatopsis sp. 505]MDS0141701.1 dioxygenase [Amycolatopsis sp. CM201R]
MDEENQLSRKTVLKAALAAGVAAPVALIGGPALARANAVGGTAPELTPACHDGDEPTIEQTEGPYFKPNSPERTNLVTPGTQGTRLTVTGYVFGRACLPINRALLDFWQADVNGAYDNTGYTFRGHQYTNAQGAFTLSTIVPGLYPGRTRHIHVKVQAPGRPILTTQLYFPGEPRNNTDTIFDARLLMTVRDNGSAKEAAFDFVLNVPQTPTSTRPTSTSTSSPPTSSTPPGGTSWAVGTAYPAGARVTYGGLGYVCLQAHTAQPGWEPPAVPALWRAE